MMVRREGGLQPGKLYRSRMYPEAALVVLSVHGGGFACPCVYLQTSAGTIHKSVLYVDEWEELRE